MTERPAILAAKLERLAEVIADGNDLKGRPKSDRPGEASLDSVRSAHRDSVRELMEAGGSVAAVQQVQNPTDRLEEQA